jgi:hypothetical protein
MTLTKFSRILAIVGPMCEKARALPFLVWTGPALILAISVLAGYENWGLAKTKIFWLAAEYLVLLPLLLLIFIGAYHRKLQQPGLTPAASSMRGALLPLFVFLVILVPLAFALDRGTYQGDENAYLFQARCLNAGALYTSQPEGVPLRAITYDHHVILNGKWFGKYPAGWPLVLALGTATHSAWFLNPLLGAALLLVTFKIGAELFGAETGTCTAWIVALSAFFSLNCLGFMSHVLCGLLIAIAVLCYAEFSKRKIAPRNWVWIAGAFVCLAGSALVRPFTALCAGIVLIAVWSIRLKWSSLVRFLCCSAVFVAVVFASMAIQNRILTGSYLRSPYDTGGGTMRGISLHPRDLMDGLIRDIPRRLVDTGAVAFPYIYLLAMYGLWRRRRERIAWALALVFLSLVVGHIIETADSDSPIGERYYFEGFFAVAVLAALGWLQLVKDLRLTASVRRNVAATAVVVTCTITIMCTYWETGFRWPSRQLMKAADHPPIGHGIVFVEGYVWLPPWRLNFNKPGSETLFVNDPGPSQRAALAKTSGRLSWTCLYYDPAKKDAAWSEITSSTP